MSIETEQTKKTPNEEFQGELMAHITDNYTPNQIHYTSVQIGAEFGRIWQKKESDELIKSLSEALIAIFHSPKPVNNDDLIEKYYAAKEIAANAAIKAETYLNQ